MVDARIERNMMTAIEFVKSLRISQASSKAEYDEQMASMKMKNQLIERRDLHFRCRRVNDLMCLVALFGLIMMIIDYEFRFAEFSPNIFIVTRSLVSISTLILVGLVLYYHVLDIRLYAINNHIADWRITITIRNILFIVFECFVCSIHPFFDYAKPMISSSTNNFNWIEVFLSLPMFARLYLIARSVTLHSPLVSAASSRTIGYLNRVPITISFILRAFLQTYPAICWTCVMFVTLIIATWSLRACEKALWFPIHFSPAKVDPPISSLSDALWYTIVTFTTVGYGDVVPHTHCGRVISTITAFFGVFASAVLIAVFTSKISLNRSEQLVLDFVDRINRARAYRQKTMEIIQYSVRAWYLKRNGHRYRATFNSLYRLHSAIQQARFIKQEQRIVTNGNESLMTVLSDVHDEQKTHEKSLNKMKQQMIHFEEKISSLENKLDSLVNILTHLHSERRHSSL